MAQPPNTRKYIRPGLAGLATGYTAGRLTWGVEYDDDVLQDPEGLGTAE
jgi:hypothetical protein